MGKRQYTQREWKLLSWWLATYHPQADLEMQVRVGPTKPLTGITEWTPELAALARVRNRWADCVFKEDGTLNVVEAKMNPDPGIFSQLLHYARKIRADPYFLQYRDWPLRMIAVVYNNDPSVEVEAAWYGVQWIVFQPNLEGFLPPQLLGTPIDNADSLLPQDWPARLSSILSGGWASK